MKCVCLLTLSHCTITDFEEWKYAWESENGCSMVKATGTKTKLDTKAIYFYCNRTGKYKCQSSGKRNSKSHGSPKMDAHCTAGIQLIQQEKGLHVMLHKTHYGHSISLGKIRLSRRDRLAIAGQLAQGISFERILDDVRDTVGATFQRLHLLCKKDQNNIEHSFSLRTTERHAIDSISMKAWFDDMVTKGCECPVLLYKMQGCEKPDIGDATGLGVNDFALVIQTLLQDEIMRSCAHNDIVCADATHGTNSYDFQLISALAVDEFGEGYPFGWCLSNREDQAVMFNFFKALKLNAGVVQPKWIMADDAEQYMGVCLWRTTTKVTLHLACG